MDPTSCWHWFKHNITESWGLGHTVNFVNEDGRKRIVFTIIVRPTRQRSTEYWLKQIRRPIAKALLDDGAQQIIQEKFGVTIEIATSAERSKVNKLGAVWENLEERSLSSNRKVILVIDDEKRKLEDLFLPLMDDYHVIFAYDAKDAFTKLQAGIVHLAIVDMQVGSGGLWNETETQEFKLTGLKLSSEIRAKHPQTNVGILTGTRHALPKTDHLGLVFFLRKPIDPEELTREIHNALR
jgi:CheY-like chemotaxis protein